MRSIPLRRVILVAAALVLLAVAMGPGLGWYHYFSTHVSTDDAYVDATVVLIAPRVSGTVNAIYVEDNWVIKGGDVLLTLDPHDFQVRVDEAHEALTRARETVDQMFSELSAANAAVMLADAQLKQTRIDYDRAKSLRDAGVVSSEFYDQATTALNVASANKSLAEQEAARVRASLGGDTEDHSRYQRAIVEQAESALEAAKLDLGYTQITAPVSGIVTHKSVHVGHRIQVGQPLMSLVPVNSLYVTANFKETQLTDVRVGQPVEVEADIYPGYTFRGHVDSISMGTGAAFSLLPPENATGNWVKVVQRVPVKIVLDSSQPTDKQLRMGLSVEVAINTSDTRGPMLSSTLQTQYDSAGHQRPAEALEAIGRRIQQGFHHLHRQPSAPLPTREP